MQHYCRASILLHARCLGCIVLFFLFSDIYACYCHIYHLLFWKMISYNRQDICMQDNIGTYIPCQPILVYHGFLLADEGRHEESQIKQSFQRLQITEIASSYLEYLGIDRRVSCTCAWPWYRTTRNEWELLRRGYVCPSCSCLDSHAYGSHNPLHRTAPEADSCHPSRDGPRGSRNR